MHKTIHVNLDHHSYEIQIKPKDLSKIGKEVRDLVSGDQVIIITQPEIQKIYHLDQKPCTGPGLQQFPPGTTNHAEHQPSLGEYA